MRFTVKTAIFFCLTVSFVVINEVFMLPTLVFNKGSLLKEKMALTSAVAPPSNVSLKAGTNVSKIVNVGLEAGARSFQKPLTPVQQSDELPQPLANEETSSLDELPQPLANEETSSLDKSPQILPHEATSSSDKLQHLNLYDFPGKQNSSIHKVRNTYPFPRSCSNYGMPVGDNLTMDWVGDGSEVDYKFGIVPQQMDTDKAHLQFEVGLLERYPRIQRCIHIKKTFPQKQDKWKSCSEELQAVQQNFLQVWRMFKPHCELLEKSTDPSELWVNKNFACECLNKPEAKHGDCLQGKAPGVHPLTTRKGIKAAACARPEADTFSSVPVKAQEPIIAVVVGTVSRGKEWEIPLMQKRLVRYLRQLGGSLEKGFEYNVYVVIGTGDLMYDNEQNQQTIRTWFASHVAGPAQEKGIIVRMKFLHFFNILMKFGPPFNYVTECAFRDGASFIYRTNDDSMMDMPWAKTFVGVLQNLDTPWVGMVGPADQGIRQTGGKGPMCGGPWTGKAMTIDFTHRTHHLIHKIHYPVVLTDWWTDDWVNQIYLPDTKMCPVHFTHKVMETNYQVDSGHAIWVAHEIDQGIRRIAAYKELVKRGLSGILESFQGSCPSSTLVAAYTAVLNRLATGSKKVDGAVTGVRSAARSKVTAGEGMALRGAINDGERTAAAAAGAASALVIPTNAILKRRDWEGVPVVLKEYKLVFFMLSKVACQQYKQLFRRMMGLQDWDQWKEKHHNPRANGLVFLDSFSVEEATHMLNAPDWTRAMFVRDQCCISAYADKIYRAKCLGKPFYKGQPYRTLDEWITQCLTPGTNIHKFCRDDHHFKPQERTYREIATWVRAINFWGRFEHLQEDTRAMLMRLPNNAWAKFGASGWGANGTAEVFAVHQHQDHQSRSGKLLEDYRAIWPKVYQHVHSDYEVFGPIGVFHWAHSNLTE